MDITTLEDVKQMVNSFYNKVQQDDLIGPIFENVVQGNWQPHLDTMYTFWQSLLLGERTYNGRPFPPHMHLPVTEAHFERWLSLFHQNINEQFEGKNAEEAKSRAVNIANVFIHRINTIQNRKGFYQ